MQLLSLTLSSPDHLNVEEGIHAEDILEALSNLIALAESNANDFVAAGGVPILSRILNGPLASPQLRANAYSANEKTIAARCVHTLCFTEAGRREVDSDKDLPTGALNARLEHIS